MSDSTAPNTSGIEVVAGVDGARGGWVMAISGAVSGTPVEFSVWISFRDLWVEASRLNIAVVAVDMPIGLPGLARRSADAKARELLGPRRSSLFWTPPMCVLGAHDHAEANRRSRERTGWGLSTQSFNLMPKIREVRDALPAGSLGLSARPRACEVHPETSFAVLAGAPMRFSKRTLSGLDERLAVLSGVFAHISDALRTPLPGPPRPTPQDLLDAAAAAWTARRIASGEANCLGEGEFDATVYPMHIWA